MAIKAEEGKENSVEIAPILEESKIQAPVDVLPAKLAFT